MKISTLALLCVTTMASACTSTAPNADQARICDNLLHYFPTPNRMPIMVDGKHVMSCQGGSREGVIEMAFHNTDELMWWASNRPDRTILDDDGSGEY